MYNLIYSWHIFKTIWDAYCKSAEGGTTEWPNGGTVINQRIREHNNMVDSVLMDDKTLFKSV